MKFGKISIYIFISILFFKNVLFLHAEDKIESVPLINLEELSPSFEEDKDSFENVEEQKNNSNNFEKTTKKNIVKKSDKIYINIKALNKITAKTSDIRLLIGEKNIFGSLEIKGLKCQHSENSQFLDTVAYLQVKDLASKDNNQVFLFNGWTFASSPSLRSIDHPIYDLWIINCENI